MYTAEQVQRIKAASGLTRHRLAGEIEVHINTLTRAMSGKRYRNGAAYAYVPSAEFCAKITRYLEEHPEIADRAGVRPMQQEPSRTCEDKREEPVSATQRSVPNAYAIDSACLVLGVDRSALGKILDKTETEMAYMAGLPDEALKSRFPWVYEIVGDVVDLALQSNPGLRRDLAVFMAEHGPAGALGFLFGCAYGYYWDKASPEAA